MTIQVNIVSLTFLLILATALGVVMGVFLMAALPAFRNAWQQYRRLKAEADLALAAKQLKPQPDGVNVRSFDQLPLSVQAFINQNLKTGKS